MVTVATVCFAFRNFAKGVTNAPLYLYINGSGSVLPLQNGQSLVVGQTYDMQGIPDAGFEFSSWQPVNVFDSTTITLDSNGDPNPPVVSITASPVPVFTLQPDLEFTMQPQVVLFDIPGVRTVTRGQGWQVDFVPVPEPSSSALILCEIAAVISLRRKSCWLVSLAPSSGFDNRKAVPPQMKTDGHKFRKI
jgi:hypothetical protein